jgi:transketolase
LIGTGNEVSLCLEAQVALKQQGVDARVISIPSGELFEQQDEDYREAVLPPTVEARVSLEKAARLISGIFCFAFGRSAPC